MKQLMKEFLPGSSLIILMLIMSVLYGDALPDQVPVHFGLDGQPDRWEDKETFLYMLPLIMAGVMIGISVLLRLSPKIWSMPNARGILGLLYFGCAVLIAGIHIGILLDPEAGTVFRMSFSLASALFLIVVGNLFGKSERNFFIGIRVPWTIASDDNWSATHRVTGRLMVLGGILLFVSSFVGPSLMATLWAIVLPLLLGCLYSFYYYWTRERKLEES